MRYLIIFIVYVFCGNAYASSLKPYYFKNYDNKNGLSNNSIYDIAQDRYGFMWFGTENGLNRFDGYTFKNYFAQSNDSTTLGGNKILDIHTDKTGRLWVLTNGGVSLYNHENDSFSPFSIQTHQDNYSYFFDVESDDDGRVWFAAGDVVITLDSALQKPVIHNFPGEYIRDIDVSITDSPWVLTHTALYCYKPSSSSFERAKNIAYATQVLGMGAGQALIGSSQEGLLLYDQANDSLIPIIENQYVRTILHTGAHQYWIGTESGVYIYELEDGSIEHIQKNASSSRSLSDNAVYSLFKDSDGGMWVGSFFGGLSHYTSNFSDFKHLKANPSQVSLENVAVREIFNDSLGNLWFGTEDEGLKVYNTLDGEVRGFSHVEAAGASMASNIHGLLLEGDRLWIGSFDKGLYLFDTSKEKILRNYNASNESGLQDNFVESVGKLSDGRLVVGCSSGAYLYDHNKDQFYRWEDIHGHIFQIFTDFYQNTYLVSGDGLFIYKNNDQSITHHSVAGILSLYLDNMQTMWITTQRGVARWDSASGTFKEVYLGEGLDNVVCYRILQDNHLGYYWISTARGLICYDIKTQNSRLYGYNDGLHEVQFNYNSSYKTNDGTLYFGTINGMLYFNPRDFVESTPQPQLYITGLSFANDSIPMILPLDHELPAIELPYDSSTFTISYLAIDYSRANAIEYAFKIDQSQANWTNAKGQRSATFVNLNPGDYTFTVRSSDGSGRWLDNDKSLRIVIHPPLWRTNAAYVFYVLLKILIIYLIVRYRRGVREKERKIKQHLFEVQKEKEVYDEKVRFFTFITHEIMTPLSLIKVPLERIIHSGDGSPQTLKYLDIMQRNANRLENLASDILDIRKLESQNYTLQPQTTELLLYLGPIIESHKIVAAELEKDFTVSFPSHGPKADIDQDAMTKIMDNLLSNALKYSQRKIHLELIVSNAGSFTIEISNDGELIPMGDRQQIFEPFFRSNTTRHKAGSGIGLSFTKLLTELHNGQLSYSVSHCGHNLFSITLPINHACLTCKSQEQLKSKDQPEGTSNSNAIQDFVVLVVEDNSDMREFICSELSGHYSVLESENGREALQVLRDNNVDLVVSDVMMPLMDGFELCNTMRETIELSHIPIILLTAQRDDYAQLKGLKQGANAYLTKPFKVELLLAQIENIRQVSLRQHQFYQEIYTVESPSASRAVENDDILLSKLDNEFLSKADQYIRENITNSELTAEMFATQMGMSTSTLYRKIKALTGVTIVDYIRLVRLRRAVELIDQGHSRVSTIAYDVGFSSPNYFAKCFKKQYGISPSEYAKKL